jgi:hypothetical protein
MSEAGALVHRWVVWLWFAIAVGVVPASVAEGDSSPLDRARDQALADALRRLNVGDVDEAYLLAGPWRHALHAAVAARVKAATAAKDEREAGRLATALLLRVPIPGADLGQDDWDAVAAAALWSATESPDADRERYFPTHQALAAYGEIKRLRQNLSAEVAWPAVRELALWVAREDPAGIHSAAVVDEALQAAEAAHAENGTFYEQVVGHARQVPGRSPAARTLASRRGADLEAAAAAVDPLERTGYLRSAVNGSASAEPDTEQKATFDRAVGELRAQADATGGGPYAPVLARAAVVGGLMVLHRFDEVDRTIDELEALAAAAATHGYPPAAAVAREMACSMIVERGRWSGRFRSPQELRAAIAVVERAAARYADTPAASAALLEAATQYERLDDAAAALAAYRRIAERPRWWAGYELHYQLILRSEPHAAAVEAISNHHRGRGEYAEAAKWLGGWEPSSWCGVSYPFLTAAKAERLGRLLAAAGQEEAALAVFRGALAGRNGTRASAGVEVAIAEVFLRRGDVAGLEAGLRNADPKRKQFYTAGGAVDVARAAERGDVEALWHAVLDSRRPPPGGQYGSSDPSPLAHLACKLLARLPAGKPLMLKEAVATGPVAEAGGRSDWALLVLAHMQAPEAVELIGKRADGVGADDGPAGRTTQALAVLGTRPAYDRLRRLAAGPDSAIAFAARYTLRQWPVPGVAREIGN